MKNRVRSKQNSGFTLVEVLATVAIMAILLSVSVVSVGQYMNTLKLTELDNAARAIYMAAQNRAVRLSNARRLSSLVDPDNDGIDKLENPSGTSGWHADDDIDILYYVSNAGGTDSPIIEELLARDDIDSALEKGYFYIVYELKSGSVTDVFYAEEALSVGQLAAYATAGRSARLTMNPRVGYYSGEVAENTGGGSYSPDTKLQRYLNVTIENTEKLTVTVTVKGEYATVIANNPTALSVRLGPAGEGVVFSDTNSINLMVPGSYKLEESGEGDTYTRTYTRVLDSLTDEKKFKNLEANGKKVTDISGFVLGGNFKVEAAIINTLDNSEIVSAEDTNNSLFAYIPGASGDTAYIKNLRHLQNLDANGDYGSGAANIAEAIQIADIPKVTFENGAIYNFIPIGNSDINSAFTGSYDGRDYTISGLNISGEWYVGLFGQVRSGTVQNVTVEGTITGKQYVGGVVGRLVGGTVTNCHNSGTVEGDSDVGGVVGSNIRSTVTDCTNTEDGVVDGGSNVGGVVGNNSATGGDSTVSGCTNDGTVKGSGNVGGIVGYNAKVGAYSATVTDGINNGEVKVKEDTTGDNFGGVVGNNGGDVTGGINNGTVNGDNKVGGIVGDNSGTVSGSKNINNDTMVPGVAGNARVGGVVGNNAGSVTTCSNASTVKAGTGGFAGGVAGINNFNGTVSACWNSGAVGANEGDYVGGIAGLNRAEVINCYNIGAVSGNDRVGGVVGSNNYINSGNGVVTNCYNIGDVTGTGTKGGVVGNNGSGTVQNCYFLQTETVNVSLNGIGDSPSNDNAIALTELEFGRASTFASWGVNGSTWVMGGKETKPKNETDPVTGDETGTEIHIVEHDDGACLRPILTLESGNQESGMEEVEVTASGTYLIRCANALAEFRDKVNAGGDYSLDKTFKLTADIDLNGSEANRWTPIGSNYSNRFKGTFDGGDYTISKLYINTTANYQGLFGYVAVGGYIHDLTVSGNVTGGSYVGGVVGANGNNIQTERDSGGTVKNCVNRTTVKGTNYVGGVVGNNFSPDNNKVVVQNCDNYATVTGDNYAGGIAGSNTRGIVTGCNNFCEVEVTNNSGYAGGIVGLNETNSEVNRCSNTADVKADVTGGIAGGIAGLNKQSYVENCWNSGLVNGRYYVGGIVGYNANASSVSKCYNVGTVSGSTTYRGGVVGVNGATVTNCHYLDTCGASDSGKGEKKSAAEFGQLHETLGDAWEKGGPFSEEPTWRPILKENREPDPDPDPEP